MSYSEKDLVDAIKLAAKSFTNVANKPGIFYTSGLKYTVNTSGHILSMKFVDKNFDTAKLMTISDLCKLF